jgi:ADP-heptose:LPS heptosyltransferase
VGLFRRSFPQATIHGTRWEGKLKWDPGQVDASLSVGALGKFYRNEIDEFPRKPYLIPDPDRVEMWRGLFAKQGKPVIGIAWSGGVPWTAERFRRWTLPQLLPLFGAIDAVWISLEYRDSSKEIAAFKGQHPDIDIRQYPFGTLTDDYDDTAALVAALDCVVAMQTSVIHLAGAIGKDCLCFVNKYGQAHYGVAPRSEMDWYGSVRLYRQGKDGTWPIEHAATDLAARWA